MAIEIDLSGRVALVTGGSRGLGRADAPPRAPAPTWSSPTSRSSRTSRPRRPSLRRARAGGEGEDRLHRGDREGDPGLGRRAAAIKCDVTDREQVETVTASSRSSARSTS